MASRQLNHPNWTHKIKLVCVMKTLFEIANVDDNKNMKSPIQVATLGEHSFLFLEHCVELWISMDGSLSLDLMLCVMHHT